MSRVNLSFWLFVALVLTTSCAQPSAPQSPNTNETVISATPPFQTKEPERYRATRTIKSVTATGEVLETRNSIARDGEMRRDELEIEGRRVVYIERPEGRIVLLPDEKQFADLGVADHIVNEANEYSDESLSERLLRTPTPASTYQRIGAETINGRNTQKYRVVVNTSANANVSVSETVIWVDDALQMPIKSETESRNGYHSTMELSEIALEVDQSLFRVPEGYKKITFEELLKLLKLD